MQPTTLPSTPGPDAADACAVQSLTRIGPVGGGLDWSRSGSNRLLISKYDEHQVKQLYTINPDGSDERCLSCKQVPGGPPVDVHKGIAHWHPSGEYIFTQVEMSDHPSVRSQTDPGSGRFNDVWATTADGSQWWQLTDYSGDRQSAVLFPIPSHDGSKLAWSQRLAAPKRPFAALAGLVAKRPPADLWGQWQINVADLEIGADGPRLLNTRSYTPGNAFFYETQAWSPDDSQLYFTSNIDLPSVYTLNDWVMDLDTQELTAVTKSSAQWNEQMSISPDGQKILLMSSRCCQWDPNDWKTLRAELYLKDLDGSDLVQLTHFNSPGYPESTDVQSVVSDNVWSPDGRQAALRRILLTDEFTADNRISDLWILTFAGPCGLQTTQ